MRRADAGASPLRALAGVAAALLLAAFVLERAAHDTRSRPAWPGELLAGEGTTLFLSGHVSLREDEAVVGPGAVELLVRAPAARESLGLTLGGAGGFAHPAGQAAPGAAPVGCVHRIAAHRIP